MCDNAYLLFSLSDKIFLKMQREPSITFGGGGGGVSSCRLAGMKLATEAVSGFGKA